MFDFGLAKAVENESTSPDLTQSPTLSMAATQAGVILGTAGYMAPEQARGKPTDRRADIWAWGVVLFEMLAGGRAFEGEDVSMILAHVLSHEPDWEQLPPTVPPPVRELLNRCLRKDVSQRIQSIGDVRIAVQEHLADPAAGSGPGSPEVATRRRPPTPWWPITALSVIVAGMFGWWLKPLPQPRVLATEAILPAEESLITEFGSGAVLSPDGSALIYSTGRGRDPSGQLYRRPTDSLRAMPIPGTDEGYNPFVSPDGQWLGFVTPTSLKKVAFSGGAALTLSTVARARGAAWGPDGTIVFAPNPTSPLLVVSEGGGTPEPLTTLEGGEIAHRWPQFLPDGRVLFTAYTSNRVDNGVLKVLDPSDGSVTRVHSGGTYGRYVASGHLLFWRDGTIFGAPLDLGRLRLEQTPAPLLESVIGNIEGGAQFDVSDDGTLVYSSGDSVSIENGLRLSWVDASDQIMVASTIEAPFGEALALSPDGRQVAVERAGDHIDIWVVDLERDTQTRLTFGGAQARFPVWFPDGRFIYFASDRESAHFDIYRVAADGSSEPELVLKSEVTKVATAISNDGRLLAYERSEPETALDVWVLSLEDGTTTPFANTRFVERDAVFSPDGRWIAYSSDESGGGEIYVRSYPDPGGRWQVSSEGGSTPRWSVDGETIYYIEAGRALKVDVTVDGEALQFGRPELCSLGDGLRIRNQPGWAVAPDGDRFLMLTYSSRDAGVPAPDPDSPIVVRLVFNWFEELRAKLRTGSN